jgi:hypothetical protein
VAGGWDYLIVTASNALQAAAYQAQLRVRQELDLLPRVRRVEVVADLEDQRIGSGGSTVYAITQVLNFERPAGRCGRECRRECSGCDIRGGRFCPTRLSRSSGRYSLI